MTRPVAVAITGGIGAGKSEALKAFARHGAATVSSDEIVHHLLRRAEVREAVVARMGQRHRRHPTARSTAARSRLSSSTTVRRSRGSRSCCIRSSRRSTCSGASSLRSCPTRRRSRVTEVPLLYETGGDARFDKVVVITAPTKLRRARSEVATDDREARLIPDAEKVQRADFSYQEHRLARGAGCVRASVIAELWREDALLARRAWRSIAVTFLVVDQTSPPWYERLRYPLRYSEYVRVHAREHRLDPALVAAVIYQESKFRPSAKSSSGAIGLMQLTPETAHGIAIRTHGNAFHTQDLYNAEINIRYGAWYLDNLFKKYGSERLVLAAYNAGQGNVDSWRANGEAIQFAETRAYVETVEDLKKIYRNAWRSKLYG